MKIYILFVFLIFASNSVFANSAKQECNMLLRSANSDWLSVINEYLENRDLSPLQLQALLAGQNPFAELRSTEALVIKPVLDLFVLDLNSGKINQAPFVDLLEQTKNNSRITYLEKGNTKEAALPLEFIRIKKGKFKINNINMPMDELEVLSTSVSFGQVEKILHNSQYKNSADAIIANSFQQLSIDDYIGDEFNHLPEEEKMNFSFSTKKIEFITGINSTGQEVKDFPGIIKILNDADPAYKYRLPNLLEMLWIMSKSSVLAGNNGLYLWSHKAEAVGKLEDIEVSPITSLIHTKVSGQPYAFNLNLNEAIDPIEIQGLFKKLFRRYQGFKFWDGKSQMTFDAHASIHRVGFRLIREKKAGPK